MFPVAGLFKTIRCPQLDIQCRRNPCPFSHDPSSKRELPQASKASIAPKPKTQPTPKPSSSGSSPTLSSGTNATTASAPTVARSSTKRPATQMASTLRESTPLEHPQKLQKSVEGTKLPISRTKPSGVPILRINAAHSIVPLKDRQRMISTLYDVFLIIYEAILPSNPDLASEHALAQEEEVYKKCTKTTYRNTMATTIAGIKKRERPTSINHPSVGTNAMIAARAAEKASLSSFQLLPEHLQSVLISKPELEKWGFVVDIPEGAGGDKPHAVGEQMTCERCNLKFIVREDPDQAECTHHWGRPFRQKVEGSTERIYTCCSLVAKEAGCTKGPHVFYERSATSLHSRHAFSFTPEPNESERITLDIACLDCEMIYTTGGFRVARVSVVDGAGKEVFDELVKMDEGVSVVDYNTRWSGISALDDATQNLEEIRTTLSKYIDSQTILIGHALDNDLKTLRMLHLKVVDTTLIFPHPAGHPYKRALRHLVKEYLGEAIQNGGGSAGHSSLEDARATLDLVRWWVKDKQSQNIELSYD